MHSQSPSFLCVRIFRTALARKTVQSIHVSTPSMQRKMHLRVGFCAFLLLLLFDSPVLAAPSCKDQSGSPVDWFVIVKPPWIRTSLAASYKKGAGTTPAGVCMPCLRCASFGARTVRVREQATATPIRTSPRWSRRTRPSLVLAPSPRRCSKRTRRLRQPTWAGHFITYANSRRPALPPPDMDAHALSCAGQP